MPTLRKKLAAPSNVIPSLTLDDLALVLAQLPTSDVSKYAQQAGGFTEADLAGMESDQLIQLLEEVFSSWESKEGDKWLYQAAAMLCRVNFEAFVRLHWDQVAGAQPMQWNWHLRYLIEIAQTTSERVFAGLPRENDVVVNIAPGTSKSTIFSILLPAWIWTRMPKARIISASHADDLVMDLATRTRSLMMNDRYRALFPEIQFSEDQNAKGHYRNNFGGERKISTIAGISPMGFHAHFIIVDDPLDPKRAISEASRLTAKAFFTDIIKSRKVDKKLTVTFLIMQRLCPGDPTDVLLENARVEGAFPVKHICLPAELTDDIQPPELAEWYTKYNQDAGCDGGGLMDPMRLDHMVLKDIRATSAFTYCSQYLQKPVPPGGGMFKRDYFNNRKQAAPLACRRVRYWDRASSLSLSGCATAGVLMARDKDGSFYVEHVIVGHWEPAQRNANMRAIALRDRTKYGKYEPTIWIEREGGSSGRDAWLMAVRALAGFTVKEHNVQQLGKKDVRAEPWSAQLAAGNVHLVQDGTWDINAYIDEHLAFRQELTSSSKRTKLCDQIDASSGAFSILAKGLGRPLPLRTYALGSKKKGLRRIVFTSREELPSLEIEARPSLILAFTSPQPPNALTPQELVPHALPKNLAALTIACADLDPADYQETWSMPLAEYYDQTPEQVMLSLTHGKKIWSYLLRDHGAPWDVLVVVDDGGGDRRAPSAAQAIADMLRIERSSIFCHGERATPVLACPAGEHMAIAAPNSPAKAEEAAHRQKGQPNPEWPFNTHIFDTLKRARSMVVG